MGRYSLMAIAWVAVLIWVAVVVYMNRKNHPKALFYLFFVEMWERFSYYGMRALLVLYAVSEVTKGGLGFDEPRAYGMYAAYGAMVYLTPILGGYLAEKFTGYRKAIIWGAILMAAGQMSLMISNDYTFIIGLSLLVLGNGFFKPNISSLIGKLYPTGSPYRDSGFTIFYMGINMGAFLTALTCGTVGEDLGWHYGFGIAGFGMVLGLIIFLIAQAKGILEDKGYAPSDAPKNSFMWIFVGTFALVPLVSFLISKNTFMDIILGVVGALVVIYVFAHSFSYEKIERQRLWVVIVLLMFTALFWTFFELAGSAINVFTMKNVDKNLFGIQLVTSNFQSFNPLFIMMFAPFFTWLWPKLSGTRFDPPAPVKFGIGIILLGCGFFALQSGKAFAVNGSIPAIFLGLMYLLHTLGELVISPTGLSLVTKLSPAKLVSFIMGFWFLSSSIAHQAGKFIAGLTTVPDTATVEESMIKSLEVFNSLGIIAVVAGVFLLCISPILSKWMHGIK